jgi:hypothetical protein
MSNYKERFEKLLDILYEGRDYSDSQNREEFLEAWDYIYDTISKLEKRKITFLEIGADKGLWSIIFFAVCKELGKEPSYTTATLIDDNNSHYEGFGFSMNNFLNYSSRNLNIFKVQSFFSQFDYDYNIINGRSQDETVYNQIISIESKYDLVFIDGDHTYDGVKKDIELYSPLCNGLLIFHDILPKERKNHYVQVYPAIIDSGLVLDIEFIHDNNLMGIGIKNYLN